MSTAHVVIAVKHLATAKTRLADSFSEADRARLVVAMLRDTIHAARAVDAVGSITVVTPDPTVAEVAVELGARVVDDPAADDDEDSADRLNSAFAAAVTSARSEGELDIIVLQADLPALRPGELAQAYESAGPASRSVVTDHHGTGTAALILKAGAGDFTPLFGPASASRHRQSGAHDLDGHWPGLRLDVDTIDDVRQALSLGVGTATTEVLRTLGW
ncbi:2-phospho-L-lactate guanylyltransferase [Rhodococcoides kyotonense]|uniref:Phosphoenolpyruvate guanylyltransferase n=1 Tax=Rhodococcoides kyotonense TaxID=398843 RepID=A0A239DDN3_9NOCA|nr:2-phospho-L-lactate guanylyltransferase [Rhodococcus kyotonensis]SNS30459.1 2-phospho-L-lactate guanylyltransferase [Rhodococcus kyotonensis]